MNNTFGQFKIYPRGFLGAVLEPVLLKQGGYSPKTQRLQYDMTLFDPREERSVTANTAIDSLFARLVRHDVLAQDFDFREESLTKILQAFGTQDFNAWYAAQFQSPSFGILHHRFLDDTLGFIWGDHRTMSVQTWDEILVATQEKETAVDSFLSEKAERFFLASQKGNYRLHAINSQHNQRLVNVVQNWVSRPNGFSDLLYTAHILFGVK